MKDEADGTIALPTRLHHHQVSFSPGDIITWCTPIVAARAPSDKDWCLLKMDPKNDKDILYFWYANQEQAYDHASLFRPTDADCAIPHVLYVSVELRVAALADRVKSRVGNERGDIPNDAGVLQRRIMDRIARASEQHKTHTYVLAEDVPPNFVPVLKKHFHVQPVSRKIGADVFGRREYDLEQEYLRICWSSWGVASMKDGHEMSADEK